MSRPVPTDAEKLAELLQKARRVGTCLICHKVPNPKGYCYITLGRTRRERAHRFVYETIHGKLTVGQIVMHSCDVRNCINPDHLRAGTVADNQKDMSQKGRGKGKPATPNREANQQAIDLWRAGKSFSQIGEIQGVGSSTAYHRVKRATELGL